MDIAHCTADGRNYSAQSFEALDERLMEEYRRHLICPECRFPAFFRKESKSGQAACFGARPHDDNCSLAAVESSQGGSSGPDREERINLGERIEIDFAFGAHAPMPHVDPQEPFDVNGRGGHFAGGQRARHAVMHRRLSTLLKNLMHSEDFRNSDQLISMAEGEYRVSDLFVSFGDIEERHLNSFRGYWGMITDAAFSRTTPVSLWLNSGAADDVSIVVDPSIHEEFVKRFQVKEVEEFSGSYVLVFGTLKVSARGKKFVSNKEVSRITLSVA